MARKYGRDIEYVGKDVPTQLYILGHGRHGKDTVAEFISGIYGITYCSSSWFMAEEVVYPALKELCGYTSVAECFADRANHRTKWYDLIAARNPTGVELSAAIFNLYGMYVGLRNKRELDAVRKDPSFNAYVIWVDASVRARPEPKESMTVRIDDADAIIFNNTSEFALFKTVCKSPTPIKNYHMVLAYAIRSLYRDALRYLDP